MARSFKRPFQPSINSYSGRVNQTEPDQTLPLAGIDTVSVQGHYLPATIQSSLLDVGMRVRKSVPEGYKTKRKVSATAPPTFDAASDHSKGMRGNISTEFPGLVPYCGIPKVGDYSLQPAPAEDDIPPLEFDTDDWSLSLLSSQESSDVTASSAPTPASPPLKNDKKRHRQDADDEDLGLEAQPVSPRSRPVSHTRMPNLDHIRQVCVPKSRRKPLMQGWCSNDNLKESEMIDVGDFGDASYLE